MVTIDWDEYKEYKKSTIREDNFEILLEFLKSYYNMTNPSDIYKMIEADEIGEMMLHKRAIYDAEALEHYLFQL